MSRTDFTRSGWWLAIAFATAAASPKLRRLTCRKARATLAFIRSGDRVVCEDLNRHWGYVMLHVGKFERYSSADRNALAMAALEWCRAAREHDGVNDSRFYWIDPNEIAVVTDAEPGAWGPGSGSQLSERAAKAIFGLADLARSTSTETWADARSGAEMFNRAQ